MFTRGQAGETYCVGGCNELTNVEVVRTICAVVAEETGASAEVLEGLITYVADRPGHDQRYAIDPGHIQKELGWSPSETFETGLRKTVRWYLDNNDWIDGVKTGAYRDWINKNYDQR